MAEFESPSTASDSASTYQHFTDDPPKTVEREGLPAGYRMRADRHYVDQLSSRASGSPVRLITTQEIDAAEVERALNLEPLTRSIRAHGVIQPLLVRKQNNRYAVIAGHKRLAAARAAGLTQVPCLVHQVDESEARSLAEAENVRLAPKAAPPPAEKQTPAELLRHAWDHVSSIRAATALLIEDGRSIGHGIGVDLVRMEAWRAWWLLRAHGMIAGGSAFRCRPGTVETVFNHVLEGFASECRLSQFQMRSIVPEGGISVPMDEEALALGVAGAVVATLGIIERPERSTITLAVGNDGDAMVLEVRQDAAAVAAAMLARLFDPSVADRPGGWPTLVGALAAKTAAEHHGGSASIEATGRGTTIKMRVAKL